MHSEQVDGQNEKEDMGVGNQNVVGGQVASSSTAPGQDSETRRFRIGEMVDDLITSYRQLSETDTPHTRPCESSIVPSTGCFTESMVASPTATDASTGFVRLSETGDATLFSPTREMPMSLDGHAAMPALVSFSQPAETTNEHQPFQDANLLGRFVGNVYTLATDSHESTSQEVALGNGVTGGQEITPVRSAVAVSDPAEFNGNFRNPQPVHPGPQPTFPCGTRLGSLQTQDISPHEALFYFGVLAVTKRYTPVFEYAEYFDREWIARVKVGKHTIYTRKGYDTKFNARADTCREALDQLKAEFGDWETPPLPWDEVSSENKWFWSALLQAFCDLHNLKKPEYTRYNQESRFRYEVDVGGSQYFSVGKAYDSVTRAIHASAHYALYCLLLGNVEDSIVFASGSGMVAPASETAGPLRVQRALNTLSQNLGVSNQTTMSEVHHALEWKPAVTSGFATSAKLPETKPKKKKKKKKNKNKVSTVTAVDERAKQSRKTLSGNNTASTKSVKPTQAKAPQPKKDNVNLMTISPRQQRNPQLTPLTPKSPAADGKVTLDQVQKTIAGCKNNRERESSICRLLKVERPKYRITPSYNGRGHSCFDIEAYFDSDPYLRRAGTVARIIHMDTSRDVAEEACAAKVVNFLYNLVKEKCGEDEDWYTV